MDPVVAIAMWAVMFVGSHLAVSSHALRPRLVAAVGEQAYRGIYSLVAFATFIPLVLVFARHKHAGAMLWNLRATAPVRWVVWMLMLSALTLFVASLFNPNPGSLGASPRRAGPAGVLKITRHPGFVAFTMFGAAHMLMNGFAGDLIFFATFPALGILGGIHQDQRKEAQLGASYSALVAETSFVPGVALLERRQSWTAADTPWLAIGAGLAVTAFIVWLHPMIFGGYPLGFPIGD